MLGEVENGLPVVWTGAVDRVAGVGLDGLCEVVVVVRCGAMWRATHVVGGELQMAVCVK